MLEDTSESAITVTSVPTTGSMSAQEEEHYGHYIEQEQVHLIRCGKYVESTITILIFISICICIIFTKVHPYSKPESMQLCQSPEITSDLFQMNKSSYSPGPGAPPRPVPGGGAGNPRGGILPGDPGPAPPRQLPAPLRLPALPPQHGQPAQQVPSDPHIYLPFKSFYLSIYRSLYAPRYL